MCMTMLQHCDKMIPLEYPDRAKQRTFFNQVIITSDNVDLVMGNIKTWTLLMDRSEVCMYVHIHSVGAYVYVFYRFQRLRLTVQNVQRSNSQSYVTIPPG